MSGLLDPDPRRMPLGRLVALTGHRLNRRWQQAVAEHTPLSRTALTALTALAEHHGLTHREVAQHCWVRPATLTPVVDGLEADGLLSRRRDASDRRAVRLHITDAGREALRQAWRGISSEFREITPATTPAEEAVIRRYLLSVLNGLDAKEGGSGSCG
ncbi:MarR family transcriptional regulator [Saccharopolyspora taberi]|uniref:HTH marR-type domain-containing protein n=1 Tax=Saccharopolyspora taberi TaxID=60895 RepID=A0ABN3VMJ4_9PSEU